MYKTFYFNHVGIIDIDEQKPVFQYHGYLVSTARGLNLYIKPNN